MKISLSFLLFLPIGLFSQNILQKSISTQNNDIEIRSTNIVDITSSDLELAGKDGANIQETFLRFDGINLPSDAIINSVNLVFYGDETSSTSSVIKIFGEIGDSTPYPTTTVAASGLSVKSRNYTSAFAEWNTNGVIINSEYTSPDLKNVVKEMFPNGITKANLAFRIQGNQQGSFTVKSFSAVEAYRPKLVINYWSNFGSTSVVVSATTDDARENTSGVISTSTAYLYLGGRTDVKQNAVRFQNVRIPKDSEIKNAYIEFYSYGTSPAGNIEIQSEIDNASIYTVSSKDITNRNYSTTKTTWQKDAITADFQLMQTPNLKNIIDEARLSNWKDGDALAFKFFGNATTSSVGVRAFEGGVNYRPRLVIEYENNGKGASIDGAITDPALMDKLFINEVAAQGSQIQEEDWIELYNDSDEIYHIKEKVYISDKNSDRKKHELKNIIIPAKGYLTLIADELPSEGNLHLNFDLKNTGESLYLSREVNGTMITQDELTFGEIPFNNSYGRSPNGSGSFISFVSPTYKSSNDLGKKLLNVGFSNERGIYADTFNLTLTVPTGNTLKYTIDGKFPSEKVGTIYTSPILIDKTTVVKVYSYDNEGNNSGVIAHSYILKNSFDKEVNNTSYSQWLYKNNITADEYAKAIELVPVVSVTTEAEPTANWVLSSVEYLDKHLYPTRKNFFSAAMTKRFGQESIGFFNPNLKFKFHKDANVKKANYPFFDQYPGDIYQTPDKIHTIELKQGQDNPSRNVFNLGFMRWSEKITMNLQKEMEKYALDTRYVQLFINGKYRGLKTMRNDYKTNNVEEVFGDDDDNYTKVNLQDGYFTNGTVDTGDGNLAVWTNIRNIANTGNLQQLKTVLDIDDLIKFQIMFMFTDTENEATAITHNTDPNIMKAKFMINDTDGAFFGGNVASTSNITMNPTAFAGGGGNYKYKWLLTSSRNGPAGIFGKYMGSNSNATTGNLEFKTLVKDAVLKYIGPASGDFNGAQGAPLSVARVQAKMTETLNELDPLYKVDAAYMGFTKNVYELWKNVDYPRILQQTPERVSFSLKKWLEYNMAHTLVAAEIVSNKTIKENEAVKIVNANTNTKVYYTINGTDPMGNDGIISSDAIEYQGEFNLPIGSYKLVARPFTTNNWGPLSTQSINVESSKVGKFVIKGINYKPQTNGDAEFLLITNAGNADLDVSGYTISDAITYTFPKGSIIGVNQTIMLAKNLTLITEFDDYQKIQWTSGSLNNSGEPITFKDASGNIVDFVAYSNVSPWPLDADGKGYYLSLKSNDLDNSLAESWQAISITPIVSTMQRVATTESTPVEEKPVIYPNPVKDTLSISVKDKSVLNVYNNFGVLISTNTLNEGNNNIDTTKWIQGVYTLIISNDKQPYTARIIKN